MKRRFIGSIFALLLTLTFLPTVGGAAVGADTFALTRNKKEGIEFALSKNKLTVINLPDSAAFNSVRINIIRDDGSVQIKQTIKKDKSGNAVLPLKRLNDGYYYVELYFYIGNNYYSSYIFGDELGFSWENGDGSFALPSIYRYNKEVYKLGRSDDDAMEYYLKQTSSIQCANANIVKQAKEITEGISDDYNKALAIHDWVSANVWYVWDAASYEKKLEGDAVSALSTRLASCVGYSNLTAALLRAAGIPAKIVGGHGRNAAKMGEWTESQLSVKKATHFWNEAYVDGRWIIIDTTWDSGNDYEGGIKTASGGLYFSRYFDATIEAFSMDHFIMEYEAIPVSPPVEP
ncbi:MAG: transglutaminase-like domain-containing protein [Oscillospiraceae bacterium]|nr:transglutaminase-like domain-containing protein [Oscillospiraceae bacterium]